MRRAAWLFGLALAASACKKPAEGGAPPSASSAASARSVAHGSAQLLRAELRREPQLVSEEDLTAPTAAQRVVAVRALARIQDELSFEPLSKALADEDPAVVSWAAFGLGQLCRGREPEAVRRLVLRAASLSATAGDGSEAALDALALALGRCASDEAEKALRSWLRQRSSLSTSAALALGRVARERQRLDDATIAALLDRAAERPEAGAFFFALESLPALGPAARERLAEVGGRALERPGSARAFAARALAKAGPEVAAALRRLIESKDASDTERAAAAGSLSALGSAAREELSAALTSRARALLDGDAFMTSQHGVVTTLLEGLDAPPKDRRTLQELAQLPLTSEPGPLLRRKVMLRCRAAAVLAGSASLSQALVSCDPAPLAERREGSLALLRVLARGSLAKGRGARFLELARSPDRVVREAALELLMSHDEVPDAAGLLAAALDAKEIGVRATAAKVLARYPARAQPSGDDSPASSTVAIDARIIGALTRQLAAVGSSQHVELASLLLDAATALELLGAKPALERACGSANATLRRRAERGFAALGEPKRRCPSRPDDVELGALPTGQHRLELETDVGPLSLTLFADESPFAAERVLELARAGFYDGMLIHRAVPGFVVQWGDPDGDGFGGPDLPALRCQPGLAPFEAGSVGVALAGRDTGLSQLFVALRRAPHLDGDYSLIGRAEPGWERVVSGDRILKVRVLEGGGK